MKENIYHQQMSLNQRKSSFPSKHNLARAFKPQNTQHHFKDKKSQAFNFDQKFGVQKGAEGTLVSEEDIKTLAEEFPHFYGFPKVEEAVDRLFSKDYFKKEVERLVKGSQIIFYLLRLFWLLGWKGKGGIQSDNLRY